MIFIRLVSSVHHRLTDFTHSVVVHRQDEAIRGWRNWFGPCGCISIDGSGLTLFTQLPSSSVSHILLTEEVEGWFPLLLEVALLRLTGQMLADAGSLDGWGWMEFKVLPVSWYGQLARILTKVEQVGVWPDGLLDAYIAMIPKTDGDATPLGQRPLSVLPIVYRIWASARMGQLDGWFMSWVPDAVFSAGETWVG